MADSIKTPQALLAEIPPADRRTYVTPDVYDVSDAVPVQSIRDLLQFANSEVLGKALTGIPDFEGAAFVSTDPTSGSTIALYAIDLAGGALRVGGVVDYIAAQQDLVLIGAGEWGKSYKLDGSAAVVLTADGKTYAAVIVAILVAGVIELHAVFGAEANDGDEVGPTTSQIKAALVAAAIVDHDPSVGLVVQRLKYRRTAVDTMVHVHGAPSGDEALAQERLQGTLSAVVVEA